MAFSKLTNYFKESYAEMRKVVWPTGKTIRTHTMLVIGISLFILVYFAVVDFLLNKLLERVI